MIIVEKYIAIAKGLIKTLLPNVNRPHRSGGSDEGLYCYGLWLRHLKHYHHFYKKVPVTVLEIGPGDSLGTGLSALLSGCDYLIAVDINQYVSPQLNLQIFDELVTYFKHFSDKM